MKSLIGRKFTTEGGFQFVVAQDPASWSDQYVDFWITAPDGTTSYASRPRSLVLSWLHPQAGGHTMARTRSSSKKQDAQVVTDESGNVVAELEPGEVVAEAAKPAKPKTMPTAEVAARFVISALVADPTLDRKQLGELAEDRNAVGEDAMNGKAVVEAGKVGEIMPANKVGHYVAESMSWLYEHRTDDEVAPLVEAGSLIETQRGSKATFSVKEPPAEDEDSAGIADKDEEPGDES